MKIIAIGTATPKHVATMEDRFQISQKMYRGSEKERRVLPKLYEKSRVQQRHSCILGSSSGDLMERQSLYESVEEQPDYLGPDTLKRMQAYQEHATPLAVNACQQAFEMANLNPNRITDLVTVSCSGFHAPGFDLDLIEQLPLKRSTSRTHVGFMGCHGGLNGLRTAAAYTNSNPDSAVLLCATELCTLHYQYEGGADQIVANALFADGAMAVIGLPDSSNHAPQTGWRVAASTSYVIPDSVEMMSWSIGNQGFEMTLSSALPQLIYDHIKPWLSQWLATHDLSIEEIRGWAVHPGGPRILAAFQEAVELPADALRHSYDILQNYGNMSSATVFFILQQMMQDENHLPCLVLGFGPGITVEAALLLPI
ncbi:Alpha-pyrone synthesis polyketide synthase-like Pks18 [Rubinisphaera italica]|uniref:Alpha-pyrone synthesis polyketide synthase-like Pks18 n=2 Tax=Rubinisphaera italica TaxID=2527969 RepID=A0A5C5XBU5_9PLAN|nr:Alpha-pyrone synthesis polyketide synthase-like Pks18 [Rubinisphaera italica]